LNENFRFGRREIGASVTGTGRQITKFMGETIGQLTNGLPCTLEKRYARYTKKPGGYSFAPAEEYAIMLKRKDYEGLKNLPLIPVWSPSAEDPNVLESSPAIWFTENEGVIYGDTDSQPENARIKTSLGDTTFGELFSRATNVDVLEDGREFAVFDKELKTLSYSPNGDAIVMSGVDKVYRHRVSKKKYTIKLSNGKSTSVTSDHSLMVERAGALIEIKPADLRDGDVFLTVSYLP
jgi:hypothetical protein